MSSTECLNETELLSPGSQQNVAHCIDPLQDRRWDELVERHPQASVFHSSAWLSALARTYQYRPIAYASSNDGRRLESGMVFCQVESWLTGRRLVSLPFSDHCEPLVDRQSDLDAITIALEEEERQGRWRYIEMRPLRAAHIGTSLHRATLPFTFHQLDLSPDLPTLFRNCHKNSTQRKILRAEREALQYCEGSTGELLDEFYRLLTITRQRHHRPPQPRDWFVNLIESFGDALKIRVALKGDRPVAAIVTIRHKDTMYYKYGGSDRGFNHLGGMHFLLWGAIQEAKSAGVRFFDFGRTDADQHGLITFKKRWGTVQSDLIYSRYSRDVARSFESSATSWKYKAARYLLARMQPGVLSLAGRALYRHVG
jgi:lipid II:glycine glycyltransferase (peptidoglycan interpeptide bridge formation enzyme)